MKYWNNAACNSSYPLISLYGTDRWYDSTTVVTGSLTGTAGLLSWCRCAWAFSEFASCPYSTVLYVTSYEYTYCTLLYIWRVQRDLRLIKHVVTSGGFEPENLCERRPQSSNNPLLVWWHFLIVLIVKGSIFQRRRCRRSNGHSMKPMATPPLPRW